MSDELTPAESTDARDEQIKALTDEAAAIRAQYAEMVELCQSKDDKLSKARAFLVELTNAHEAQGKIQKGWKINAQAVIDEIDG